MKINKLQDRSLILNKLWHYSKSTHLSHFLNSSRNQEECSLDFAYACALIEKADIDRFDAVYMLKSNKTVRTKIENFFWLFRARDSIYSILENEFKIENGHCALNALYFSLTGMKINDEACLKNVLDNADKFKNPFEGATFLFNEVLKTKVNGYKAFALLCQSYFLAKKDLVPIYLRYTDIKILEKVILSCENGDDLPYVKLFAKNYKETLSFFKPQKQTMRP